VIGLWDLTTGHEVATLHKEQHLIQAIAFSPDCNLMGTVGDMGLIRIWDLGKGAIVNSWKGHVGIVTSLSFSPDGSTLASGGLDGTVRSWHLREQMKGNQE
jgi:WD40 repeat protein